MKVKELKEALRGTELDEFDIMIQLHADQFHSGAIATNRVYLDFGGSAPIVVLDQHGHPDTAKTGRIDLGLVTGAYEPYKPDWKVSKIGEYKLNAGKQDKASDS